MNLPARSRNLISGHGISLLGSRSPPIGPSVPSPSLHLAPTLAMGIGRDSRHKHYKTGGRSKTSIKKRKYVTWRSLWLVRRLDELFTGPSFEKISQFGWNILEHDYLCHTILTMKDGSAFGREAIVVTMMGWFAVNLIIPSHFDC